MAYISGWQLMLCLIICVLKQVNASNPDTWTVYYWGSKNRGNFIKLLFEYKRVKYTSISDYDEFSSNYAAWNNGVFERNEENSYHTPLFAPPSIRYIDASNKPFYLSQTAVVTSFVAQKLDIGPKPGSLEDFQARKILLDCFDVSQEIYALAKNGEYRTYTRGNVKEYIEERFEKWLNVFEFGLSKTNKYYFGNNEKDITFGDLAVFNLMDGLNELFGSQLFDIIFSKHGKLVKLYKNIGQIPSIAKFIQTQNENNIPWFNKESIVMPMQASLFPQYGIKVKNEL